MASSPFLDRLLAEGIIRQDHYDAALARQDAMPATPWTSLGEALLWLMDENIVSGEDLDTIENLAETEGAFAGNATRRQALAEMDAAMEREFDAYTLQARQARLKGAFSRARWAWLGGGMVAIAVVAWFLFAPATPPQCGDAHVQETLRMNLFRRSTELLMRDPRAMASGLTPADIVRSSISGFKEVGYIKTDPSRGCTATIKIGSISSVIAYIIKPNDKGNMMISGEDVRVVRARYGQVDKNGKPLNIGQPAGAARLITAFEQGVAAFDTQTQSAARNALFDRQRQRFLGQGAEIDTRSVRNVQPLGNCKDLGGGNWSCRLQAEFHDRLMASLGQSDWQVIEGNFDFTQDGATWRVGENFVRQYRDAVVRGRVAALKGDEAAARLEEIQSQRQDDGVMPRQDDETTPQQDDPK